MLQLTVDISSFVQRELCDLPPIVIPLSFIEHIHITIGCQGARSSNLFHWSPLALTPLTATKDTED